MQLQQKIIIPDTHRGNPKSDHAFEYKKKETTINQVTTSYAIGTQIPTAVVCNGKNNLPSSSYAHGT